MSPSGESDAVRERILDAAARLRPRGSPLPPAMGSVAQAAGVSRATLYRRFPSAEALQAALTAERAAPPPAAAVLPPRQRLLDAARHRFAQHGVVATAVAALVEDAQVSTATLYSLFGDKMGLLHALVDVLIDELHPSPSSPLLAAHRLRAEAPLLRLLLAPGVAGADRLRDAMRASLGDIDPIAAEALLATALYGEAPLETLAQRLLPPLSPQERPPR